MVRLPVFLLLFAAVALPAWAQIQPRSLQTIDDPKGEFTLGFRMNTHVDVTFRGVGALASPQEIGDQWSEMTRFYDDGSVVKDQRTSSSGGDLPDDGRTNTWRMGFLEQVIDEDKDGTGDAIAFHRFSTENIDGTTVSADSATIPGIDLDYSYTFGQLAGRLRNKSPRITWGGQVGMTLSTINAKNDSTIHTNLFIDEDRYSLDGATPPTDAYTAPSSETVSGTDQNGNSVSNTTDTTILLANRPYLRKRYNRDEQTGELLDAPIAGFWQVRGGALTARAGMWMRYRPFERFAIRAGAGLTGSFLGLTMRYDERLDFDDVLFNLRYQNKTSPEKFTYFGAYGTLDVEWWMTSTTALFVGANYEKLSEDIEIPLDGRTADIRLGSGTGFRFGFTKLF